MRAPIAALSLLLAGVLPGQASRPERVAATVYYYWYDWPDEHFPQSRIGGEAHLHRLPNQEKVSYKDPAWHKGEFAQMAACDIDVVLPAYYGAWGAYDFEVMGFARAGLPPIVQALDELLRDGGRAPKVGLFYDTTTLVNSARGVEPADGKADLTAPAGKQLFCGTVVDYFRAIPERHWARFHGGVLVVLYVSTYCAGWDGSLGQSLRDAFAAAFPGERLCLVADRSWGAIGQDLTTAWGGALDGPRLFPGVAQIGPGYDDSALPSRSTPRREREDGLFYEHSWLRAAQHGARLVILETWNEMHEGTEICETVETGRLYLDLTRRWIEIWKTDGRWPALRPLRWRATRARSDPSWGGDSKDLAAVRADYARDPALREGLREIGMADGAVAVRHGQLHGQGYVYFQVCDAWRFEKTADYVVTVSGEGALELQYDSSLDLGAMRGAYALARVQQREGGKAMFLLRDAWFGNRQTGGADFRLVARGPIRVAAIEVSPLRKD
jgi:hypothetical protein